MLNPQASSPSPQLGPSAASVVAGLRSVFDSGRTRPYAYRLAQLEALERLLVAEEGAILAALKADLGKPAMEGWLAEINDVLGGVRHVKKHLKAWMKPERAPAPLWLLPGKARIQRDPLGVVLIIAPWNYPFSLALNPLVGAIAAGNTAVVKPSEVAPSTSRLLAELLPRYLDAEAVKVVEGGVAETTALLAQRFDHIFYTGNGSVGRIVMAAAAKHLTPVTLELGGKSPCIVMPGADLTISARRIAWAKFMNCGQTCIAPDYVLAHEAVHDAFLDALKAALGEFYAGDPKASPDYGRIVNRRHHQRLTRLLPGSGRVLVGGEADEDSRYLAPTVLVDVPADAPVMEDEIFGPILPVLKVPDLDAAVGFVNARPKPLAAYLFGGTDADFAAVAERTSSGGLVHNHAVIHIGVHDLPFGGVGESGQGAYHGRHSFETFSHRKAVVQRPFFGDVDFMYPPYNAKKQGWLRRLT
jgi:aldehyde dehydrogenase (NAD+)